MEKLEILIPQQEEETKDFFHKTRQEQIKDVLSIINSSLSVSFGILLTFLNITINLTFAGQIDDENITAGIGLCVAILNCLAFFFTFGLNQGCGSLVARALGSNSIDLMRDYYNKGIFTLMIILSYLVILSLVLEQLLITIGQNVDVSHYAWVYFVGILPGLACMLIFDLIRVVFNAMGMFNEPMVMQFISLIVQFISGLIFVTYMNYGFQGIIIATNISYISMLILILLYAKKKQIDIKPHFDFQQIKKNYKSYLVFCLHIALPTEIDSLCFEFNSLLLGSLQMKDQFNSHVLYSNLSGLCFSISLGIAGALCTLISNAVGEKNIVKAKNYFKLSYVVLGLQSIIFVFIYQFFSEEIVHFYTNDEKAIYYFLRVLNIHKFFLAFDYIQGAQAGILKGLGEGRRCIKYFIISFYLVGNSLSFTFGYLLEYGVVGFWTSLCVAITVIFCLQTNFLLKIDWKNQINQQYEILMKDKQNLDNFETTTI